MAQATYISKDQNWQDETTTYWFELTGTDYGTGYEFNGEKYGVVEDDSMDYVDEDGTPINWSDNRGVAVRNTVYVTDEIRAQ